jgi:hypothetical protein
MGVVVFLSLMDLVLDVYESISFYFEEELWFSVHQCGAVVWFNSSSFCSFV